MIYFYARVSSRGQHIDRQLLSAKNYPKPIGRVFEETQSGKNFERPVYQSMKNTLKSGDEVVVHALDRLGRNKKEMKEEISWYKEHGVILRVLDVPTTLIDFQGQDWIGEMVTNILIEVLSTLAQNERENMLIRQREGLEAKKARNDWSDYGRPKKETPDFEIFLQKQKDGLITVKECCDQLGISRSVWYDRVRKVG